uniref:Uncharacterized protein n=1 Tax=Ananas comosus var. bracteatus TaxID=296719 RepID=A0A6V7QIN9_ANACO|nr:unnamed protein product [Ananas comosus var. bracteatus]
METISIFTPISQSTLPRRRVRPVSGRPDCSIARSDRLSGRRQAPDSPNGGDVWLQLISPSEESPMDRTSAARRRRRRARGREHDRAAEEDQRHGDGGAELRAPRGVDRVGERVLHELRRARVRVRGPAAGPLVEHQAWFGLGMLGLVVLSVPIAAVTAVCHLIEISQLILSKVQ